MSSNKKIIFIILLFTLTSQAQKNDFEAGLYNIGGGIIISSIGSILNKKPNEKLGPTLIKSISQGALGGFLVFQSKNLIKKFSKTENYGYVWPSNILNAAGTSFIENGAANRPFGSEWHINLGFNRLEITTNKKFKLKYRIMPFSLIGTLRNAISNRFDFEKSIKTGFLIFTSNEIELDDNGNDITYGQTTGSNSILILNNKFGKIALPHEIIHVYQYEQFSGINMYLNKAKNKYSEKNKLLHLYNKIFYTDFNYITFGGLYYIGNPDQKNQIKNNFFEREAEYYNTNTL
ncbi:hypothetical protein BC962_3284 [Gillisia mitskevichiae]|uniref:Uncharacterized protein n=1 Tax=Gillisia mitskevichiae TaxID=270921 RepID=A0A495NXL7_9FLAO|nr:hypothetical protein [Gillisia mitskevichiae]RKS42495.1 hypothetical protein BC962_3284 [Gillisia mitskevichiae]